jgi:hypothetical protein
LKLDGRLLLGRGTVAVGSEDGLAQSKIDRYLRNQASASEVLEGSTCADTAGVGAEGISQQAHHKKSFQRFSMVSQPGKGS